MAKNEERAHEVLGRMAMARGGKKPTKTERILHHLVTRKRGITPMTAYEKYNTTRLGSIIFELRHHYGIDIETIDETKDGMTYARYIIGRN